MIFLEGMGVLLEAEIIDISKVQGVESQGEELEIAKGEFLEIR